MKKVKVKVVKIARTREIKIRMSDEELAKLNELSRMAKTNASAYIRASALNKPLKVIPEPSLKLVGELGRIGNNLNQYQRSANSNSTINFIEIDELIGELKVALMGGLK